MLLLILGLLIFLGAHSVAIVAPAWRHAQVEARGEKSWKALHGAVSLAGFALIVYGYGLARGAPVVLYQPPTGLRHVAWLVMLPVFTLLLASRLPGRISSVTKHPMLAATKLWALAHLLANGTLGSTLLFASFLAWAVADRISLKRRAPGPAMGKPGRYNDAIAIVAGLGLYVAFIGGVHLWLIGVSPR